MVAVEPVAMLEYTGRHTMPAAMCHTILELVCVSARLWVLGVMAALTVDGARNLAVRCNGAD